MKNEVLVVTGGSRGIGAAIARRAAKAGYSICLTYSQDRAAAERLVDELRVGGAACRAVQGRVEELGFASRVFDAAEAELGPMTALVNNAGITGPIGPFANLPGDEMRRIVDVNLLAPMLIAQEAVRRWRLTETEGRMVNISSIAATLGAPNEYVAYAATKGGLETFTVGLAKELAPTGIRINAVSPGTAYTDIHAAAGEPDRPQRVVARIPMGRIALPDEIANAVIWLLSEEANYVTGTVLRVAGGL